MNFEKSFKIFDDMSYLFFAKYRYGWVLWLLKFIIEILLFYNYFFYFSCNSFNNRHDDRITSLFI